LHGPVSNTATAPAATVPAVARRVLECIESWPQGLQDMILPLGTRVLTSGCSVLERSQNSVVVANAIPLDGRGLLRSQSAAKQQEAEIAFTAGPNLGGMLDAF